MIFNGLIAPSGNEDAVREALTEKLGGKSDNLGNLIVRKNGIGKRIAIACPVDEYGVFVSNTEDKNRICPIGSISPLDIINCTVKFTNGIRGVVCSEGDISKAKFSDLYVEAEGKLKSGDVGAVVYEDIETNEFIMGSGACREAVCSTVLSLMEKLKDTDFDITYIFTSMYFTGKKGLHSALLSEKPDFTLVIDTVPDKTSGVKIGNGGVFKLMEGGYSAGSTVREYAKKAKSPVYVLEKAEIRCANPVSFGADTGYISVPCTELNKFACKILKSDVQKTSDLAKDFIQNSALL